MLFGILIFIILITIIVGVHEYGHLYYAKKYGVYCPEFSIGIGPIIFSKKYKGTYYKLRLLPIGGFVNICDNTDLDFFNKDCIYFLYLNKKDDICKISEKKLDISNDYIKANLNDIIAKEEYVKITYTIDNHQKIQHVDNLLFFDNKNFFNITCTKRTFSFLENNKKVKILFAGALFNFILGIFCIFLSTFIIGTPQDPIVLKDNNLSGEYSLKKEDKIIAIDEKNITTIEQLKNIVDNSTNNFVCLTVQDKDGKIINTKKDFFHIQVKLLDFDGIKTKNIRSLGIIFQRSYDFSSIIKESIYKIFHSIKDVFLVLFCLLKGSISFNELTGFIGIASHTQSIIKNTYQSSNEFKYIFSNIFYFLGFLSINTGAMNLLPIPILDGGRIFFIFIEKIFKRKIDPKIINILINISLLFVLFIFIYVSYFDILKLKV